VRVRILTRPPEEPGGGTTDEVGEVVCALRDLGVAVDLRARMHEKIAILDDVAANGRERIRGRECTGRPAVERQGWRSHIPPQCGAIPHVLRRSTLAEPGEHGKFADVDGS
jgi:hypothetical protein